MQMSVNPLPYLDLSLCRPPRHWNCPLTIMVMRVHSASHSSILHTKRNSINSIKCSFGNLCLKIPFTLVHFDKKGTDHEKRPLNVPIYDSFFPNNTHELIHASVFPNNTHRFLNCENLLRLGNWYFFLSPLRFLKINFFKTKS